MMTSNKNVEDDLAERYSPQIMEYVRAVARYDDYERVNTLLSMIIVNAEYRNKGYKTEGTHGPLAIHESFYDREFKHSVFNGRPVEEVLSDLGNSVFIALLGGLDEEKLADMRGFTDPDERQRCLQLLKDAQARLSQ